MFLFEVLQIKQKISIKKIYSFRQHCAIYLFMPYDLYKKIILKKFRCFYLWVNLNQWQFIRERYFLEKKIFKNEFFIIYYVC